MKTLKINFFSRKEKLPKKSTDFKHIRLLILLEDGRIDTAYYRDFEERDCMGNIIKKGAAFYSSCFSCRYGSDGMPDNIKYWAYNKAGDIKK